MGKEKINNLFIKNKKEILSIYLTTGYPEIDSMPVLAEKLAGAGVDFLELGMPYSDPLADGETIQYSSSIALKNGIDFDQYFNQAKAVRQNIDIPLLFMGYFNQVLRIGIDTFLDKCVDSGIDGLIIPDMPPEVYKNKYKPIFDKYDLGLSFLITPTTSDERIKMLDELSSGFVYVVSTSSTTGKTIGFSDSQIDYFKRINKLNLNNPMVIGFGISDKQTFRIANKHSDGAIIGSAFIKALKDSKDIEKTAMEFAQNIIK